MPDISLTPLTNDEAVNLNAQHPEIIAIWRKAAHTQIMKHTQNWAENSSSGEVLWIKKKEHIVGITGWYDLSRVDKSTFPKTHAAIRWHGILLNYRSQGISKQAMTLLAKRIQQQDPIKTHLVEFYPTDRPELAAYFTYIGFKHDDQYHYPNPIRYTDHATLSIKLEDL